MENSWSHVPYTPEDFALASSWVEAHGRNGTLVSQWLSDTGFILCHPKPVIFFWMYFDPSCTASFVDWVITKPGTPLPELKEGITYALWGPMRSEARRHHANVVVTRSPMAMARVMERAGENGWLVHGRELMSMAHVFTQEEIDEAL